MFPVYRPGGSKRADWNFFFFIFSQENIFLVFPLYILVYFFAHPVHRKRFCTEWPKVRPPHSHPTIHLVIMIFNTNMSLIKKKN